MAPVRPGGGTSRPVYADQDHVGSSPSSRMTPWPPRPAPGGWAVRLDLLGAFIRDPGHAGRVRTWPTRQQARHWLLETMLRDPRFRTCEWSILQA